MIAQSRHRALIQCRSGSHGQAMRATTATASRSRTRSTTIVAAISSFESPVERASANSLGSSPAREGRMLLNISPMFRLFAASHVESALGS